MATEGDGLEEIDLDLDAPLDPPVQVEKVASIEEIKSMIAQLSVTEEGEPLKNAMQDLKKGIKSNPAACSALLPEDIGAMVASLLKMTGRDLQIATEKLNKRATKGKKVDLAKLLSTPGVQQEILDDL